MGSMEPPFADNLRISQPMELCLLEKYLTLKRSVSVTVSYTQFLS